MSRWFATCYAPTGQRSKRGGLSTSRTCRKEKFVECGISPLPAIQRWRTRANWRDKVEFFSPSTFHSDCLILFYLLSATFLDGNLPPTFLVSFRWLREFRPSFIRQTDPIQWSLR